MFMAACTLLRNVERLTPPADKGQSTSSPQCMLHLATCSLVRTLKRPQTVCLSSYLPTYSFDLCSAVFSPLLPTHG